MFSFPKLDVLIVHPDQNNYLRLNGMPFKNEKNIKGQESLIPIIVVIFDEVTGHQGKVEIELGIEQFIDGLKDELLLYTNITIKLEKKPGRIYREVILRE